jgi:hypothetical protein
MNKCINNLKREIALSRGMRENDGGVEPNLSTL